MPLYEYKCHKCGKTFETLQKFSDNPLETHPGCGGAVEKLISAPAFHLKGTGWYATDYAKTSGVSPKPDEAKSETKTDTKTPADSATPAATPAPAAAAATQSKPAASSTTDSK